MESQERTSSWAVAYAIAYPIVGQRPLAIQVATGALASIEERGELDGGPVPWLVAATIAGAIGAPRHEVRSHEAQRATIVAALAGASVASRVVFGLRALCGYDLGTTAAFARRTPEQVVELLAPFAPIRNGLEALVDPDGLPDLPPPLPASPISSSSTPTAALGGPDAGVEGGRPARRRRWRPRGGTVATVLVVVGSVLLVTYPGGARPSLAGPPAAGTCVSGAGAQAVRTVTVGREQRPARLFIPTGAGTGRPLVVLAGDAGASAVDTVTATGLEGAAGAEGFVLLTLDGGGNAWNAGGATGGPDDLAYAEAAIARASSGGCADGSRVHLVGYGTGAHLAAALACDPRVRATDLVMVRGAFLPPGCTPDHPLSVLLDVDRSDQVLPFDGGWGPGVAATPGYTPTSLADADDGWSRLEGCSADSTSEADPTGMVVSSRGGCTGGVQVESRVSDGQGHAWPPEAVGATVRFIAGE